MYSNIGRLDLKGRWLVLYRIPISSEFVEAILFDEEVDGRVNHMVDDGCHCEYTSQYAHNVDEESVPLVVGVYQQHSHRVCLVPTSQQQYLK
jgi:hypothetical protein